MKELREIETKYAADGLGFKAFGEAVASYSGLYERLPVILGFVFKEVESPDYYFDKDYSQDQTILRYRRGDKSAEFTVKNKLSPVNNYVRNETNLKLKNSKSELEDINVAKNFASCLGFKAAFSIYKRCHIYYFTGYNVVYYEVYNTDRQFLNSFIEIEVDDVQNSDISFELLETIESEMNKRLPKFISKDKRIDKSLYELFRDRLGK